MNKIKNFMARWGDNIEKKAKYVFWLCMIVHILLSSLDGFSVYIHIFTHNPIGAAVFSVVLVLAIYYLIMLLVISLLETLKERN